MSRGVVGAWSASAVLFLVHGVIVGTWVSRIPAIQSQLHLNNGVLGLTLLSSACGAVTTMPLTGSLIARYGSKRVTSISSVLFCAAVLLMASAVNAGTLAVGLFLFGAIAAAMDVSMNAQAVEVENEMGKPTMSRFHGMFSVGAMAGAAAGGVAAAHRLSPTTHFAISGVVNCIAVIAIIPLLLDTHSSGPKTHEKVQWTKLPPVLIAISAIGFCILLSEGAMADWTAIYLKQTLAAGQGTAAAGYAAFSGAMALFRFLGDWITARMGPFRTVRSGCLVAALGLVTALLVPTPYLAISAFAITGAGLSVIIPLVFGSGGRIKSINPGAGIAAVTGLGYIGFIVGPPAIGFASQVVTLRYALGIVVSCCLVASLLARSMKALEPIPTRETVQLPF
jgi:MFS family permease